MRQRTCEHPSLPKGKGFEFIFLSLFSFTLPPEARSQIPTLTKPAPRLLQSSRATKHVAPLQGVVGLPGNLGALRTAHSKLETAQEQALRTLFEKTLN